MMPSMYGRSQSLDLVRTRARWNASFPALFDFHITPAPQFSGCNPLEVDKSSEPEESPSDQSPHSPFAPSHFPLSSRIDRFHANQKETRSTSCLLVLVHSQPACYELSTSLTCERPHSGDRGKPSGPQHPRWREGTQPRAIKCAWEKVRVAW
jgi:hypothetical protein